MILGLLVVWVAGFKYSSLRTHAVEEKNLEVQADWMHGLWYPVSGAEPDSEKNRRLQAI